MIRIAIIGAGLAGVTLARLLADQAHTTIFEKARGTGGRISTRRTATGMFDHGAQYFTARSESFKQQIAPLISNGMVARWNAREITFDGNQITGRNNWIDDEPRYVGVPGMNQLVKHFAAPLDVCLNTRITRLQRNGSWQLYDDQDTTHKGFDWVVTTVPAPQTLALLPESCSYRADIGTINMHPCLALMLGFATSLPLEFEVARISNADIRWIAVNSHKPGRTCPCTLVVHSSSEYARAHFDDDRDSVMRYLCAETSRVVGQDVGIAAYRSIHRWRYASSVNRTRHPVYVDADLQLAACGDWCLGGRIEDAFESACRLAPKIRRSIG